MNIFNELKRRNVFRVGIAYVVVAWLVLQFADVVLNNITAPHWVFQAIMLLLVIGFPIVLIIAWAFEVTPEGIKLEKDVDRSQSIAPSTGRTLDRAIIVAMALALAWFAWDKFGEEGPGSISPEVSQSESSASGDKSLTAAEASPVVPNPVKSIAVLPFVNMSSDPEQEYFSDGLSEELLNRLAQNSKLHVAARSSAFQFKGKNLDISDIGRQLNVTNVLEGSVRKSGNRLRITAQLIQVDNGFHLWSQTYEREMNDVFAIQDDISTAITRALEAELGTTPGKATGQPTDNLEAYNLYLQARYFLARRGEQNMRKADELFAQAVALDPNFVLAWSGMAFNSTLLFGYSYDMPLRESFAKTMLAANKAIALDPASAEAYAAIGRTQSDSYDWPGARKSFERAYQLQPNNVGVLNFYGDFMGQMGDFDAAIRLKKSAIDLDPLSAVLTSDLAIYLMAVNRLEEALVAAQRGVGLAPDSLDRRDILVQVLLKTGAFEQARALIEQSGQTLPADPREKSFINGWRALYFYRKNEVEGLRKLLADAIQVTGTRSDAGTLDYSQLAFYSLWLDGVKAALPWLEKAYQKKELYLTDPAFFYLPERMSDDPDWLKFWHQPGLKGLQDVRKAKPYQDVSFWKKRTAP